MAKDHRSSPGKQEREEQPGKQEREELRQHVERHLRIHKDQFVQPSAEFMRQKSEVFQIDRGRIENLAAILICGLERKTVFHPVKRFDPSIYEVEPYLHKLTPESLDHLKQLAGVPNEVYASLRKQSGGFCKDGVQLRSVRMHDLPTEGTIHFSHLRAEQRVAVKDLAFNLLMGYADPAVVQKPPYKAVVDYMVGHVVAAPVFVGKDLLVCPDETVEFSGFLAVLFDNVVVVGNGRIVLGNNTKLHAYQIKHV
jgi:hypothetical protein